MSNGIKIVRSLIFILGILLIVGVEFQFNKKIIGWNTYQYILMALCGLGFLTLLVYEYKSGSRKKFKEMLITGVILIIIGLLFYFI